MGSRRRHGLLLAVVLCLAATRLPADEPLIVGTKVAAPFVIRDADGSFSGIGIDLWKEIAGRLMMLPKAAESMLTRARQSFRNGYVRVAASGDLS